MRWLLIALCWSGLAAAAPLPADPRLDADRANLQALVDGAEQEGVPGELLTAKIREGLAKNVPGARIGLAVRALASSLKQARTEALPHVAQPPAALLKAIVDAHALGAAPAEIDLVLKAASPKGAPTTTRAIEVLGDLLQRKFPTHAAAVAVAEVAARQSAALDRLVARAETLAHLAGVTRADALDAIARASANGLTIDQAAQMLRGRDVAGEAGADVKGPPRETTGERGPPDRLPKGKPR